MPEIGHPIDLAAVNELAGLGPTVEVELEALTEMDGVWLIGGNCDDRFVVFPVAEAQVDELREQAGWPDSGEQIFMMVDPARFIIVDGQVVGP